MPDVLPDRSNIFGQASRADPQAAAVRIASAGWSLRKCGLAEYEVAGKDDELVVHAASPVLVQGVSADPTATAERLAGIFRQAGLPFSFEVYVQDARPLSPRSPCPPNKRPRKRR